MGQKPHFLTMLQVTYVFHFFQHFIILRSGYVRYTMYFFLGLVSSAVQDLYTKIIYSVTQYNSNTPASNQFLTSKTIITNSSDSSTEAPGLKTSTLWRWKNRLNSNAKYKYYKNFSKTKFVTETGACIRRGIVPYPRSGWQDALLDTLLGMPVPSVCV